MLRKQLIDQNKSKMKMTNRSSSKKKTSKTGHEAKRKSTDIGTQTVGETQEDEDEHKRLRRDLVITDSTTQSIRQSNADFVSDSGWI
mmetsp:Transcript_29492/g.34720  ORF Transcript_29492/g.34720 Transcript_29492/m.34720 type:complete len:87 (+) Transcript_29492:510-770(+)